MISQKEIHDTARVLLENKAHYDAMAVIHANKAITYSQASKSMKNAMKVLKKECKKWTKNQKNQKSDT
jgi:hypothetical protein